MLCYRCGSHVPDTSESCGACGQKLAGGGLRQATGTFSRRRASNQTVEGAPFPNGTLVARRYLILDAVGEGPLGFVFKARDNEADVDVALKVIQPRLLQTADERKQFSRVIRSGRKLTHQNVVRIYDDGEHEDWPFFTMQFLEGLTLRKIIDLRVAKKQFFSLRETEPIFAQIAAALEVVHTVGPHSNLKPQNVLVLPDLLKVSDFGLGLALPRMPFVQAMRSKKCDRYLAPELVSDSEVDARADVYALGVMLGEMICGQTPDEQLPELLTVNPELPPALEGFYRKALNVNPLARFSSATEFQEALSELAQKASPPPLRQSPPPPPGPASRPPPPPAESLPPFAPEGASDHIEISNLEGTLPEAADLLLPPAEAPSSVRQRGFPIEAESTPRGPTRKKGPARRRQVAVLFSLLALAGLGSGVAAGVFGLRKWRTEQKLFAAEKPADEQVSPPAVKEPSPEGNVASVAMPAPVDAALVESPLDPSVKGSEALARAFAEAPEAPVEMPCPEGMQFVPEGNFRMGTAANDADRGFDERNLSWVSVKAFCIDTYEFPNVAGAKPTASVGFEEATQSCVSKGKRLCREEEWEKACKGAENRRYPYGDAFDSASCNTEDELGEDRAIAGAGAFPRCRSGYGVVDLSGNVAEWTLTLFAGNADRAVKGGSSTRPQHAARCSARQNRSPTETSDELGFRCCADVK